MMDGSMLFTDAGWRELKIGCVFQHSAPADSGRGDGSVAVHRPAGPFCHFTQRFERVLPPDAHADQVLVTDGMQWIIRWLQASYSHATLLLDFYHVAEKLADAAHAADALVAWLPSNMSGSGPDKAKPWNGR